eukprot:35774-Eustigmatos_ZCMA.PRE.1
MTHHHDPDAVVVIICRGNLAPCATVASAQCWVSACLQKLYTTSPMTAGVMHGRPTRNVTCVAVATAVF